MLVINHVIFLNSIWYGLDDLHYYVSPARVGRTSHQNVQFSGQLKVHSFWFCTLNLFLEPRAALLTIGLQAESVGFYRQAGVSQKGEDIWIIISHDLDLDDIGTVARKSHRDFMLNIQLHLEINNIKYWPFLCSKRWALGVFCDLVELALGAHLLGLIWPL